MRKTLGNMDKQRHSTADTDIPTETLAAQGSPVIEAEFIPLDDAAQVATEGTQAATVPVVTVGKPAKRDGLTQRQEAFCRLFVETGVAADAYTAAYNAEDSSRATVRVNAFRLLKNPKVQQRVRELQDAAADRSLRSTVALIRELEEAVDADVNELVRLEVGACRHCHGIGGQWQHKDTMEYALALAAAIDSKGAQPLPSDAGGFGYRIDREPNPDCNTCGGAGVPRVIFSSTADASAGARRLLRGIELHADGSVKRVLLHDQAQLRIELHRLRGLHVDRSVSVNLQANLPAFTDMTQEQALDFLDSLRPAS
jgi:phage terminase small subunit